MPKLSHKGEGYEISITTDTSVMMDIFIGILREFNEKNNLPATKFEAERSLTLESKYMDDKPKETRS